MNISTAVIEQLSNIFYSNTMAYIASGVVGLLFIGYCIYNGLYYIFWPQRYHGIRFTTKNIAYITLLAAVSVTFTIVISVTLPVTVFPPIRIAFEGLMVKITGFIFGPIVGLLSGVITDGLTMLFVPSYIHIAYLIVISSYGFISGSVASLNRATKNRKWVLFAFANIFTIAFGIIACLLTYYHQSDVINGGIELFAGLVVSKMGLIYTIAFGTGGTVVVIWITAFIYYRLDKTKKLWQELLPIILLAVINEYWVTTLISAWGDIAFLTVSRSGTANGYGITMIARLAMAPIKVVFNTAIIYFTYRALAPLVKRD